MKLSPTKKVTARILETFDLQRLNNLIGMVISGPTGLGEPVYETDGLEKAAKMYQDFHKSNGINYTEDQAIIGVMVYTLLENTNTVSSIPPEIMHEITLNGRVFHKGDIESNKYFQNIHFDEQQHGRFKLGHKSFEKYETFHYDTPKIMLETLAIPRIGTFDYQFEYPQISEDGSTWMSVTPNEIITMEKAIEKAAGNVLTLGCGMGYYAYMVSEKEEVEHVTIVEKEQDVIDLFNTYILPQFSHKEKITVIHADAFDFMENLSDGEYDYCFADIWIGNNDSVPYMKMKSLCQKFKNMDVSYWIEDSLVLTIMGYVAIIIIEEFFKAQNIKQPEMIQLPEDEQYKLDFLRELLKNANITRPEHIDYYMNYRNIINLMR